MKKKKILEMKLETKEKNILKKTVNFYYCSIGINFKQLKSKSMKHIF